MYGAGNIGRGFIGQIFAQSGYEVCFIDIARPVIDALNRDGRYPIRILREDGSEDIWIEGVRAVNAAAAGDAAAQAIAEADIMATAVGVRAIPLIAPVTASGLKKRFTFNSNPLNIIICENLIDADMLLERSIKDHLNEEERRLFDERVGLVKASIGRMVPIQTAAMQDGNILRVCVEEYGFLPVNEPAFKGDIPLLVGMHAFSRFDFCIEQKLFIHNMAHAVCAYLGMIRGEVYIAETMEHGDVRYIVQSAMLESAHALSAKHHIPFADLHAHVQDLLRRFSNKALADTCARVGADIARKLGNEDRLIGAMRLCAEQGIEAPFISAGAAAALYCFLREKGVCQNRETAQAVLSETAGIAVGSAIAKNVLPFYAVLASCPLPGDFDSIIKKIIRLVR